VPVGRVPVAGYRVVFKSGLPVGRWDGAVFGPRWLCRWSFCPKTLDPAMAVAVRSDAIFLSE